MPQKQKLSIEKKIEIIRDYLKGRISMSEAARRGGVTWETIQCWVRNYEANGADAFLPHKNRVYSPEQKRQAVKDYLSSAGSISDICKKYQIRDRESLRAWIQVYNAHGDFNSVKHSGGGSYMKQEQETTAVDSTLFLHAQLPLADIAHPSVCPRIPGRAPPLCRRRHR